MKKALMSLAAGAALVATAGVANAGGYSYGSVKDAAVMAPQANWNGLYIGAAVGYGIATTDLSGYSATFDDQDKLFDTWEFSFAETVAKGLSGEGAQGTLTLGYDRQIHPGLLVGVFGDYTFGNLKNESGMGGYSAEGWLIAVTDLEPELAYLKTEIGNNWSIGGRLGLVRENTLWYAFAGYTQADFDWNFAAYLDDEYFGGGSGSKTLKGYFLGLGVEQQLFHNVSLKLEYRYTNYDKVTFGSEYNDGDIDHVSEFRADPDVHSVRLGVNVKFDLLGGRHGAPAYDALK